MPPLLLWGERHETQEFAMMVKKIAVAATAVLLTTSPLSVAGEVVVFL
jgi:hypothetical protein